MPPRRSTADKLKKPLLCLCVILFLASGTLYYYVKGESTAPGYGTWSAEYDVQGMEVHFLDVGQGDCTLLLCGDSAVLIDGGEYVAGLTVVDYLRDHGVEKLELVIASHRHSDHMHGLVPVLEQFVVDELLINQNGDSENTDTKAEDDLLNALHENGITVTTAEQGMKYVFEDMQLTVLSDEIYNKEENEHSVVIHVEYENTSVLFTGDIGEAAEEKLLAENVSLDCDILKVAHHGSAYSSTESFLDASTPSVAVISCGRGNLYGHPSDAAVSRLMAVGATVYRTDTMGDIAFTCNDDKIEILY